MDQTIPQAVPSLPDLINLLATSSSSPATLSPPSSSTYPSTSTTASTQSPVPTTKPNLVPVYVEIPADLLTPVAAYLKIAKDSKYSFLLESVVGGENLARYSFVGADPLKTVRTGEGFDVEGDPLAALEKELEPYRYVKLADIPTFTGGAVGFITYDSIVHFEPVTKPKEPPKNPLPGLPEAFFMLTSTLVIFDHIYQTAKIVSHVHLPDGTPTSQIPALYEETVAGLQILRKKLLSPETPLPEQGPITLGAKAESNVGKAGYEGFVTKLKEHILKGDIIQAVPSQRLTRPTALHPFNVYRHLRRLNPSPYMFYLDCGDVQLVGASPETLCKVEGRKVYNHAIAGTVRRGKTAQEDVKLGEGLLASEKDRAEHIMLVDLARNDVNRVCKPETVNVDDLMRLEKFSHVIHLTSQISGMLRDDQSRFDAFRSIFPAGTVSGAPKVKAIQLVGGLEKERRGVYAGAVGRFDFDKNELDTCIAIRTMTFKDGNVYLQAGGGIVFDSDEVEEFEETLNKLMANVKCIDEAEMPSVSAGSTGSCKASSTSASAASASGIATAVDVASGLTSSSSGSVAAAATSGDTASSASAATSVSSSSAASAASSISGSASSSASAAGASTSSSTGNGDLTLAAPGSDCKCGYTISSLSDQYFPYAFSYSFSALSDRTFSGADDLASEGWIINVDQHAGGAANGNQCWGAAENVAVKDGVLQLTMPGGQSVGPHMKCAEIAYNTSMTGGVFQWESMLDNTAGTCQAMWLNHSIAAQYADEYDIEIISGTVTEAENGLGPGMYFSNWPADGNPNQPDSLESVHTLVPFPSDVDPTANYCNYTIAWLPDSSTRYFNGVAQSSPTGNLAEHAQLAVMNVWSNGGTGWTQGPPTSDVTMKVKSVLFYYKTEEQDGLLDGCQLSDACAV